MLTYVSPQLLSLAIFYFVVFLTQHIGDQFLGIHFTAFFGLNALAWFGFLPFWQLFTYSFLHSDVTQLFFNLMSLVFFGGQLERIWGFSRFLFYFFASSFGTGLLFLVLKASVFPGLGTLLGTGGGIYAVLLAYGILFSEREVLFMGIFPLKAKQFIFILALIELMFCLFTPGGALTGLVHLTGMLLGFALLWSMASWKHFSEKRTSHSARPSSFSTGYKKKLSKKAALKLVVNHQAEKKSSDPHSSDNPPTWH